MLPISRNELRLEQWLGRCLLNHGWNITLGAITENSEIFHNYRKLPVIWRFYIFLYLPYQVWPVSLSVCHWRANGIAFQAFYLLMFTTTFSDSLTCRLLWSNISANSIFLALYPATWKLICRQSISLLIEYASEL